ncbi:MAG: efflux RND transporter periplasmic adaptor subunit [Planctomycetia bacterium]|nr:MAG: efflux RND transporter periplasmic adaptor subunit [Planctomycetia bacterium]
MATAPGMAEARGGSLARVLRQPAWRLAGGLLLVLLVVLLVLPGGWIGGWFVSAPAGAELYEVKRMDIELTLEESGELRARRNVEVRSEVEGESVILFMAPESSRVKKGDVVVELASDALIERMESEEIELRKIRADVESARQELDITRNENASLISKAQIDLDVAELELRQYLEGEYLKSLQTAEIDIEQTRQEIERKEEEIRKNEPLRERGFVTALKLKELHFDLYKLRKTLEKNELTLHILQTYDRPKTEKQKTSAVDQARQELARAQQRATSREVQATALVEERQAQLAVRETRFERLRRAIEKCRILAPADGVVQYPTDEGRNRWNQNRLAVGERVFEGQTILTLPDVTQMIVNARIHEADRHKVREGLPCVVRVPAVPGKAFHGRISRIAQFADSANSWLNPELKEHTTEILLDETDAPVSPGDSASITILIDTIDDAIAVPVQCVYTRGSRSFVFAVSGSSIKPVQVEIGRSNVRMIEILSGVDVGDRIVQGATESLLARLPNVGSGAGQGNGGENGTNGNGGGGRRGGGGGPRRG